jgi:DNA processing protein
VTVHVHVHVTVFVNDPARTQPRPLSVRPEGVTAVEHLTPLDPRYPSRLRGLARAPASLSTRGGSLEADCVVAIVGSRAAVEEALAFAKALAAQLAQAGAVVVSGGALGIDSAAHGGALACGGRTWVVAGTGCQSCFPDKNKALFEAIAAGPGAMIWPFEPEADTHSSRFLSRNRVLVTLADAVVVVQAGVKSGALHAAGCAHQQRKPLWVVPPAPWSGVGFAGSRELLQSGKAQPLWSLRALLRSLNLRGRAPRSRPSRKLSADESAIYAATSSASLHLDEIAARAHASAQTASAVLLTLALENVVVEGPPGCFRRRDGF